MLLLLSFSELHPALGKEKEMKLVTTEEIESYVGHWVLRVTSTQGEFDALLKILNEAGEIRASLDLGPLGRQSIETIFKTEEGTDLRFEAGFGDQTFEMKMPTTFEGDDLAQAPR